MQKHKKKILIISDTWHPQINGVVHSLERVIEVLEARGHECMILSSSDYWSLPMPSYPEVRLSFPWPGTIGRRIKQMAPDAIHIATEGPIGSAARRFCVKNNIPFATSYHTQFPEYLRARLPVPIKWTYNYLRRFHNAGQYCLVPTKTIADTLHQQGFKNLTLWHRGVDTTLFRPQATKIFEGKKPVYLYVGRLAVEKNLRAFLDLDLEGTKLIVGDGPSREKYAADYPDAVFVGPKRGQELAAYYAAADLFVFPSLTDTFGLVLLEALASGVPVAAYPVRGPIDVIGDAPVGVLHEDLGMAVHKALDIDKKACRAFAEQFSWDSSADVFFNYLPQIDK